MRTSLATAMGLAPALEKALVRGTCAAQLARCAITLTLHRLHAKMTTGLSAELFPFRSPLLGESLLVSFPPLNYMLKFSG